MNDTQFKEKVMFKLGAIEQHLKSLNGQTVENKRLAELTSKKVAKHELVLGKAGVVVVGIMFVLTTGINFLIDWIKKWRKY